MIFTAAFIKGAAERAIKSFVQVFVAVLIAGVGAEAVGVSAGILDVDWLSALSVAALATILSIATSIGNADFTAGTGLTDADGYTAPDAEMPYTEADAADLPTHRADA